jgi:hypothetical protein
MDFMQVVRYLFWLALILIAVAYFTGSTGLLKTIFSGVNQLGLTFTGRTQSGTFAAYPKKG